MAGDEKLLRYFMEQTEKRLDKIETQNAEQFAAVHTKLDGLNDFKIRTIVSTRWIAGLISAGFSVVTLGLSVGVSIYLSRQERAALIEAAKIEKPLVGIRKGEGT